jgi:BirA family biotin operon repressor/biotin-[acetyl-CoA-carboxylase] ligase
MTANWILERVNETGSTNNDLLERWRTGELKEPIARLAYNQTAGKGRLGRAWLVSPQDSLCFSMAYPFSRSPAALTGLSLLVGIAAIEGIAQACQLDESTLYKEGLRLKWPNDLLLNNAKLGGILIEGGQTNASEPSWMIIGVGINVRNAAAIEQDLKHTGITINSLDKLLPTDTQMPTIDEICLAGLSSFEKHFKKFDESGFSPYQQQWNKWDAFANQKVRISGAGKESIEGIAIGADVNGALLLKQDSKTTAIYAGDVSLRSQS